MPSAVSRISRGGAVTKTSRPPTKSKAISQTQSSRLQSKGAHNLEELDRDAEYTQKPVRQGHGTPSQGSTLSNTSPVSAISKSATSSRTTAKGSKQQSEEKRLRRFRSKPPASFQLKLQRASTQRMIVLDRKRDTIDDAPAEHIDIVGSTGNVYEVTISHVPSCTCPDSLKGHECKHKVYALHTVLKAPEHLQYQLALLTSELEDIFAHAPPIPTADGDNDEDLQGKRKPTDGECPICYMDLDPENNPLVWCKAQCGHNLHRSCFEQWAASQSGKEVRCVYCRTAWEYDAGDANVIKGAGEATADGYVNVADHFGMSRARDYSGYYQPWVRRQVGLGW